MFKWKWGIIPGGAALVLSLLTGLISRTGFPAVLLRAGIFGVVFFGLGCGLWFLLSNFIPELLFPDKQQVEMRDEFGENVGSRVNITLEDAGILPDMYRNLSNDDTVGNIEELVSGTFKPEESTAFQTDFRGAGKGIDQLAQDGYTKNGPSSNYSAPLGGMPELDDMAGSFLSNTDEEPKVEFTMPERSPVGNKPQPLKGDFNPKELAAGIRTVLSKDV